MRNIKIASAQFENKVADKEYNLSVIDRLSKKAAADGAEVIAFHECSITGYSFARRLSLDQMLALSEHIPDGESIRRLQAIAENKNIKPGNEYTVFDLLGWKCGILICYDNNIIENVRATKLLGADILFMPHVTMCTPSPRPGAGFVDPKLWAEKESSAAMLRAEFDGPKGRS